MTFLPCMPITVSKKADDLSQIRIFFRTVILL